MIESRTTVAVAVVLAAVAATLLSGDRKPGTVGPVSAEVTTAPTRSDGRASSDVTTIAVVDALSPGNTYRLPAFGIRNPGSRLATFRLGVSYVAGQARRPVPAEWFRFVPDTFVLGAGRTRAISPRLELSRDASPGDYAALLNGWVVADRDGRGAGAAAGARVTFGIEPSGGWEAWWRRLDAIWFWFAVAAVLGWGFRHRAAARQW